MEKQIAALSKFGQGQRDEALRLAKEAMEIELSMTRRRVRRIRSSRGRSSTASC